MEYSRLQKLGRWLRKPRPKVRRAVLAGASAAGVAWRGVLAHGTALAGLVALSVGAGQVYGPAGWITAGALLLLDRAVDDHRAARKDGGG